MLVNYNAVDSIKAMTPGTSFKADVVLIAPREKEVARVQQTYREKNFASFTERLDMKSFQQHYVRRIPEALGCECLATYLRLAGLRVAIINCNISPHTTAELVENIRKSGTRLVGISLIYRPQVIQALELLEALEGFKDITVCMGGALASLMKHQMLSRLKRLDAIVYGEAEKTFCDFACAIIGEQDYVGLLGIAFKHDGHVVVNPAAPPLDLTKILAPQRDSLSYLQSIGHESGIASLYTSRGCMAKCTYCTGKEVYNIERKRTYRFRDPIDVVDEIEYLHNHFGVHFVYFNDDNFLGYGKKSRHRVWDLAEELIRRNLGIQFAAECRVDALDSELLLLLKEAGMIQIFLGIESGSDVVLKRLCKGVTVAQNREAIKLVRQLRIHIEPGFILFDAHTTGKELSENVDFIKDTRLQHTPFPTYFVNRLSIYPGSDIEKLLVADSTLQPSRILPFAISSSVSIINDPNAIQEEFQRLEYICNDRSSEIAWRCLRQALEPVEQFIEDILPLLMSFLLKMRQHVKGDVVMVNDLIRRAVRWRREVGDLVIRFIELCIESYRCKSGAEQFRWLRQRLTEERERYEHLTLKAVLTDFAEEVYVLKQDIMNDKRINSCADGGKVVAPAKDAQIA
jgi:radical SAM superfamily enzyme YgiQ (UPF0313 family)